MNTSTTLPAQNQTTQNATAQQTADRFTAALITRDYSALSATLSTNVRLRALVPPGPFEISGPAAVTAQFEQWFGGGRGFRVLGHSTADVGNKIHAQWTVQRAPDSPNAAEMLAQQHAFLTIADRIESIDLVCSGWQDTTR